MNADIQRLISQMPSYRNLIAQGGTVIPDPFIYSSQFLATSLLASATVTNVLNIQADADFVLLAQAYYANVDFTTNPQAATREYPNCSLLITDSGSSKQLSDNSIQVPMYFGDGQFPYILPVPRFFAAKSSLQLKMTNNDTNSAMNINLAFIGVKLYTIQGR